MYCECEGSDLRALRTACFANTTANTSASTERANLAMLSVIGTPKVDTRTPA